ncbi:DUF6920 family protein [Falsiroseomonas selenitidurans]|uniref:Uncharacterized protein n=1 Tax=Falsiroseomonas selenitidurans TaxID=2716335 RepID=A0ABX1E3C5_9PROT|nr:DUF6544 family protein [Falsiroseomonas selenitidurans]NKC31682.1 hypothetical protein [Falsiroseomonas selenitidurans]
MRRPWIIAGAMAAPLLLAAGAIGIGTLLTEREIAAHAAQVVAIGRLQPAQPADPAALAALPEPVQAYLRFALPGPPRPLHTVRIAQAGAFRRPLTEGFAPTTATQTIAIGTPALMFAATTPLLPGLWARAYDFYAAGRMRMRAKILSTLGVVNERETEALNRASLRRWLLESPLYPMALLPGGPVRWEAVDARRARAIVAAHGLEATLVATFRADGSLERFDAEQDGDLTTPYHGSGEHVTRSDYQPVAGMMVPMAFLIARAAEGRIHPFWRGRVTRIVFE